MVNSIDDQVDWLGLVGISFPHLLSLADAGIVSRLWQTIVFYDWSHREKIPELSLQREIFNYRFMSLCHPWQYTLRSFE